MERSRIQKLQVNINIGPNLRRLRNEHTMTQDQLVAKLIYWESMSTDQHIRVMKQES